MPQLPIIIPLIVTGILLGSLLKSNKPKIPFRKITLWSIVSGLLNAVFAYVEFLFTPQATFNFRGAATTNAFAAATSDVAFTVGSFLAGFLIVVAVFVVAAAYLRLRGEAASETEEAELEAA